MQLRGRTAIVTGASRGIGRALAIALAKNGCDLLLTAIEGDELEEVSSGIASRSGVQTSSMPADLTMDSERLSFLDWILHHNKAPDILVNNAGGGRFGRFTSSDQEDIRQTVLLNVHVPLLLTRELLPVLLRRPEAKIVNISSGISRLPYPGLAVYGAAKGFISSFSESLASELMGTSVSVLCFHPGFTDTHFMSSAGMDISRVPKRFVHTPEATALSIIKAIKRNKTWAYSDTATRMSVGLANILPRWIKTRLFSNLFWRLPDE